MTWDLIAKIAVLCVIALVFLAGCTAIGTFIYGVRKPQETWRRTNE